MKGPQDLQNILKNVEQRIVENINIMIEQQLKERYVIISEGLEGDLRIPLGAKAIVLFAHGSGSGRYSSRNQFVANVLNNKGIATLLVDLLKQEEKRIDEETNHLRYNIELLARRFATVTNWLAQLPETKDLRIGYFGSSTGAAAALIAAVAGLNLAKAIVTRSGRPDLAGESVLNQDKAPTLFIVGGKDTDIIALNKRALESLSSAEAKELAIIPGATHLFDEPCKMEEVAQIAADWFECYLLRNGKKKFHNRYARITRSGFLSSLWNKYAFQIKFKDRFAAGEILASALGKYKNDRGGIIVIGIARGGVIVADAIAEKLNADFDIIVPRKIRSPHNSENAIGSIMQDGSVYLDTSTLQTENDISNDYIDIEKLEQKKEMERRLSMYRPYSREYKVRDRTVILVDDGIASGATIVAAARWIRKQEPKRLIISAPVAPKRVIERLKNEVDQIEVVRKPSNFKTVEQFYQEFEAVSDDQIIQIAKRRFLSVNARL